MKPLSKEMQNMVKKAKTPKGKTVYSEVKIEVVANGYQVKASGGQWVPAGAKRKPATEVVHSYTFQVGIGGLINPNYATASGSTRLVFPNFASLTRWLRANTKATVQA